MKEDKVFTAEEVEEINALFQEAASKDAEEVVENLGPIEFELGNVDTEGWDEFIERVLAEGPPVDEEEV